MKNLFKELNEFFSATSIHGLPYIHIGQTRCTRILWTILVVTATAVASNFLYQTFIGFETKHISTTIETESVEKFPFPAVTFHPGDYSSENYFLRVFLNQFHFTRYNQTSPLYDNKIFIKNFATFVKGFGSGKSLLEWVSAYLLDEKLFISKKGGLIRNQVCSILALMCVRWLIIMFLVLFCFISVKISKI